MTQTRWLPLLLLAAACDNPSAIDGYGNLSDGRYSLASIDTRALPAAEPCSADLTVSEEISLYRGEANYKQRITRPGTGQSFDVVGTGTYSLQGGRYVLVDLAVTRQDTPQQTYDTRLVFERTPDGFTQMVGMPCDGRSTKRFVMTSIYD